MGQLLTLLNSVLGGTSPITGYLGSAVIILGVVYQAFVEGGLPADLAGWLKFVGTILVGLAARFSKDENKSNAPRPLETPTTVP